MKGLIILMGIFWFPLLCGQTDESLKIKHRNSIQLEAGGHGLAYSFDYERILLNKSKFKGSAQVGISYYPPSLGILDIWIPLTVNVMRSFNQHHLEAGIGMVLNRVASRYSLYEIEKWYWDGFVAGRIGYRFQKPEGRFLFRIGFTPLFGTMDISILPLVAISFGFAF